MKHYRFKFNLGNIKHICHELGCTYQETNTNKLKICIWDIFLAKHHEQQKIVFSELLKRVF